jgi:hypothetical protein
LKMVVVLATDGDDGDDVVELVVASTGLLAHAPWKVLASGTRSSQTQLESERGVREASVLVAHLQKRAL